MERQPEVQGLRALAIFLVLGFHFAPARFPGTFVGLDIFFVISGYLITGIICRELRDKGSLNFAHFLLRRCQRILPVLLVVLAISLAAASMILLPHQLEAMAGHALAAVVFVSNVVFASAEGGYFETVSKYRPLLHTWSLGVEAQFYLLWPLFLALAWRLGRWPGLFFAVAASAIASLSISVCLATEGLCGAKPFLPGGLQRAATEGMLSVYSPLTRTYEFALGALLVFLPKEHRPSSRVRGISQTAGLLLLGYAIITYTPSATYPGWGALLPCIGTVLVIYGGHQTPVARTLTNPAAQWLGAISYSLYLVHWPTLVLYREWSQSDPGLLDSILLLLFSVCLAALLHRYVEKSWMKGGLAWSRPLGQQACIAAAAVLALTGTSTHAWSSGGWSWRYPEPVVRFLDSASEGAAGYLKTARFPVCLLDYSEPGLPAGMEADCAAFSETAPNVILFGDSYAAALMHGLSQNYPEVNFLQLTSAWCRPVAARFRSPFLSQGACDDLHEFFWRLVEDERVDAVIVSARWGGARASVAPDVKGLRDLSGKLSAQSMRLVVIGPAAELDGSVLRIAARGDTWEEINAEINGALNRTTLKVDKHFRRLSRQLSLEYYSSLEFFFPPAEEEGRFILEGGNAHTFDDGHLTPLASDAVVAHLKRQGLTF